MPPMTTPPSQTAGALAERFGLELHGDGQTVVTGVATLAGAQPGQLAFLANPRYADLLASTQASVVIVGRDHVEGVRGVALVAKDPHAAFAKVSELFEPTYPRPAGIHPSAVIDPSARIAASASIGPHVCIGANSVVGERCIVGPGCVIGEDCQLEEGCELIARVTLVVRVRLGRRVRVHPGAVLGAQGFGLAMEAGRWLNVPQLGGVVIGDDCEIGANTCIDRGALEDTVLAEDVRVDNLIQIAHNVQVGAHTAMAAQVGIAGSAKIGQYCMLAGKVGVAGHLEIGDKVTVLAMSMVAGPVTEPGTYASSLPITDVRTWRRNAARFRQLDALARRIPSGKDTQEAP
jgi:UDP-3-O-[3-hydroxymyristoyl] glucosamine N-acyltransferase